MKEAIILAGGKGTRLISVTGGGQKVVVKVGSKTFLEILLEQLDSCQFDKVYLALGHCAEEVQLVISKLNLRLKLTTICEVTPLGTGGAIKNALKHVCSNNVLVLNGDSLNDINYANLLLMHKKSEADISVLTKFVSNIARYGEIKTNLKGQIISFHEKTGEQLSGIINTGAYVIPKNLFVSQILCKFSFEEFLTENVDQLNICALESEGNFIDIGTPDDYQKFVLEMSRNNVYK